GCLRVRQAPGPDRVGGGGGARVRQRLPGRIAGSHGFERPVPVDVAGVLGEHREDELLDRIATDRRVERAEGPPKPPVYLPNDVGGWRGLRPRPRRELACHRHPSLPAGLAASPAYPPRARFSNLVIDSRNVSSSFPMGPLRCLAMMTSARARFCELSG